jgi:hypothetical protein
MTVTIHPKRTIPTAPMDEFEVAIIAWMYADRDGDQRIPTILAQLVASLKNKAIPSRFNNNYYYYIIYEFIWK